MKLKERVGVCLRTRNFRPVKAGGILSIDFDEKLKIVEIEWKGDGIYHYLKATKNEWSEITKYANKGKGLTGYVNSKFKDHHDYYQLIVLPEPVLG